MKNKFWVCAVVVVACVFLAGVIYAASAPDVIKMENKGYKKHTKGIVMFSHKKHAADYGAGCGECHHDDKGKPLTNLKDGDPVQSCIECHKETGKKPKGEKLKKKEKIMKYHKEALHANCIGCHKKFNKKNKLKKNDPKALPTTCKNCHPSKKK